MYSGISLKYSVLFKYSQFYLSSPDPFRRFRARYFPIYVISFPEYGSKAIVHRTKSYL